MASDRRLLYLLQRAARAATAGANASTVERIGVSVTQLGTLSYLAKHAGCTATDIAELLDLNKSAVSSMIGRLERAALVRRAPNPRDGRASLLFLTEKGQRVLTQARPVFRRAMADMTEGFSEGELATVFRFLNSLVERFGGEAETEREG